MSLSWEEASRHCAQLGGHLPFFKHYEEKNFPYMQRNQEISVHFIPNGFNGFPISDLHYLGIKRKVLYSEFFGQ